MFNITRPSDYQRALQSPTAECKPEGFGEGVGPFRCTNLQRVRYLNGIYEGEMANDLAREGMGVFLWNSGEAYIGQWKRDCMEGYGLFKFSFGGFAEGHFFGNKLNGQAQIHFPNGDWYNGTFRHGKLDGKCFKYLKERAQNFLCEYDLGNLLSILPTETVPDFPAQTEIERKRLSASLYHRDEAGQMALIEFGANPTQEGDVHFGFRVHDLPHGLGLVLAEDGSCDYGLFVQGALSAFGRILFANGDVFVGEMLGGDLRGKGIFYCFEENQWVSGLFKGSKCIHKEVSGIGKPRDEVCSLFDQNLIPFDRRCDRLQGNKIFHIPKAEPKSDSKKKHSFGMPERRLPETVWLEPRFEDTFGVMSTKESIRSKVRSDAKSRTNRSQEGNSREPLVLTSIYSSTNAQHPPDYVRRVQTAKKTIY
eukprot:TRINITY_DN13793_c0_g1_i1.p1 TRINITY_DN13793_c0_g1~~TRINITY_DN13793_c0_g1_i1.p1  ORF type:complete len:422 (-),score=28.38 TRINITY_DN13793_c0_g1_i1:83-1348(-)